MSSSTGTRKVRIVCISDTHNQSPKLPAGDVLIHAGDLTNQGSYAELKRSVEWLDRQEFEAKIVIAGNHEITLDTPFFKSHEDKWKWPYPQDSSACRKLLTESQSITYLEHESATVYLPSTHTSFRVFGSPYSPGRRGWAFQYWGDEAARGIWEQGKGREMDGADIVVTHTPAQGFGDGTMAGDMAGCEVLRKRVGEVRPLIHVCGHIHAARGVVRVRWGEGMGGEKSVEDWVDPGLGNKKISLLDLIVQGKGGRKIEYESIGGRRGVPESVKEAMGMAGTEEGDGQPGENGRQEVQPVGEQETSELTSSLDEGALQIENEAGVETWKRTTGGALECRVKPRGDVGRSEVDVYEADALGQRNETAMINAAFLSPRNVGKASTFNKPIVVDVELPVWQYIV